MEKMPPALLKDPKPLVFVIGQVEHDPSLKEKLVSLMSAYLLESDQKDIPPIEFRLIKTQQYFPDKKQPKETLSLDGILKLNWISKYNDILPSVVLLTFSFSAEWPITEWVRRESTVLEYVTKVKNSLHSRDIKLILVPFRTGGGSHDVYEDRINVMKKRFQVDGRHLTVVSAADLAFPVTTVVKRLSKSVREFSMAYYVTHAKRVRNIEKSIKATEPMLIARYNFKVSFLSEFQGQSARALRHYRTAYSALAGLYDEAVQQITPEAFGDVSIYEQARALAEWISYKICLLYLRSSMLKEASEQLRSHIIAFSKPIPGRELWDHYAWVSDQYIIFAETLDVCSTNPNLIDADRSYYYQNAAIFCTKRHSTFHGTRRSTEENEDVEHTLSHKYKGMIVTSPRFVGGPPQLHDPVLGIDSNSSERDMESILNYLQRTAEKKVDHKAVIIDLLKKALDSLGPLQKRRRAMIRYLMAKQFMTQGKYELASMNLNPGIEILSKDGWTKPLVAMLRKKMACALYLGRSKEYVIAAMRLIAVAASKDQAAASFGRHEREELHRDILSVIFSQGPPSPAYLESLLSDTSNAGVGYVGVTWRPQFGIAATEGHPAEYTLLNRLPIEFSDTGIDLFKVVTNFTPITVAIGQPLRVSVTITSLFQGCLTFADMSLHFTDDVLIQKLTHDGSSAGDGDGGVIIPKGQGSAATTGPDGKAFNAALIFPPGVPVKFSVEVFVPESAIGGYMDAYACLEKIRLVMRIPNLLDESSPQKTPGAVTPLAESVDSIISDSTKSFQPVTRRPSHAIGIAVADVGEAGDMDDSGGVDVFVSAQNNPLGEADAQFIPAADEAEEVEFSVTPADAAGVDGEVTPGGSGAGPLQRRRTSSTVSSGGMIDTGDLVEESINDTSPDTMPIVTTRERMSSMSHIEMENIDIAPDISDVCNEFEDDSGMKSPPDEVNEMANLSRADTMDSENEDDNVVSDADKTNEQKPEEESHPEDGLSSALGEVTDSPFKSSLELPPAPSSDELEQSNVELTTKHFPRDLAVEIMDALPDNVASAGTPLFADDRQNKFLDRGATPVMAVMSADSEHDVDIVAAPMQVEAEAAVIVEPETASSVKTSPEKVFENAIIVSAASKVQPVSLSSPATATETALIIQAPNEEDEKMYRHVCFDIITVSRMFREARSTATNLVLRDIADFVGPHAPKILHITRPTPKLRVLSDTSQPITALQGMMHRVNVIFSTEGDEIWDGKVFLSSDQSPQTPNASLFWYPDVSSVKKSFDSSAQEAPGASHTSIVTSSRFLEGVTFRPFALNSSFQPAEPLLLPNCRSRTIFCVPLFLKSDTQGTFSVKLKLEYLSMKVLSTPVTKEIEIKLSVLRPFALNFGFTSSMEAPCGAVLTPSGTSTNQTQWRSVLRGDFINLSASLNCLNSLKHSVEVLALGVVVPSAAKQLLAEPTKPTVESIFQLVDNTVGSVNKDVTHFNRYANLLSRHVTYTGEEIPLVMAAGEKFVGSVEVKCLEVSELTVDAVELMKKPSLLLPSEGEVSDDVSAMGSPLQPISIGNISIKWRTGERTQMCPVDLTPYIEKIPVDQRVSYSTFPAVGDETQVSDFKWLLPIGSTSDDSTDSAILSSTLVRDISRTLICSMTFMVPAIQVIDAPFKVDVDSPAVAELGTPMTLTITISNKLWSIERLCISAALCNRFLITGCTLRTLEVAPKGSISIRFVLVPLLIGHCPMPTIRVTWEKTKTTVVEVGSTENPRHVFVMPGPKQLAAMRS